jgi:hypothetical protein
MDNKFILYLFAIPIIQKSSVMKKDLFSQKFRVLVTLLGSFDPHSVIGIQTDEKDDPPIVIIPPSK